MAEARPTDRAETRRDMPAPHTLSACPTTVVGVGVWVVGCGCVAPPCPSFHCPFNFIYDLYRFGFVGQSVFEKKKSLVRLILTTTLQDGLYCHHHLLIESSNSAQLVVIDQIKLTRCVFVCVVH